MGGLRRRWQEAIVDKCWQVIYAGGGEIRIVFEKRHPHKFLPSIYIYPKNKEACQEIQDPDNEEA